VKGVGSFSKGVGVAIGHLLVRQKGGFSENSSASTSRRRDGVARHALGTPSDAQSGLGLLVSGSSAQLPRALNRLPESLHDQSKCAFS